MKSFKVGLIFFIIVALLLPSVALAKDTAKVAKVLEFSGDVQVKKGGGDKKFKVFKNMALTQGDTVITGRNGKATIELDKDKEVVVDSDTQLVISELVQSIKAESGKTSLNLLGGKVTVNVKEKLKGDSKFEIKTPTSVMGVRGTLFFVSVSSAGDTQLGVLEGIVSAQRARQTAPTGEASAPPEAPVLVNPMQQLTIPSVSAPPTPGAPTVPGVPPAPLAPAPLQTENLDSTIIEIVLNTIQNDPQRFAGSPVVDPQQQQQLQQQMVQKRQEEQQQQQQRMQQQAEEIRQKQQNRAVNHSTPPPTPPAPPAPPAAPVPSGPIVIPPGNDGGGRDPGGIDIPPGGGQTQQPAGPQIDSSRPIDLEFSQDNVVYTYIYVPFTTEIELVEVGTAINKSKLGVIIDGVGNPDIVSLIDGIYVDYEDETILVIRFAGATFGDTNKLTFAANMIKIKGASTGNSEPIVTNEFSVPSMTLEFEDPVINANKDEISITFTEKIFENGWGNLEDAISYTRDGMFIAYLGDGDEAWLELDEQTLSIRLKTPLYGENNAFFIDSSYFMNVEEIGYFGVVYVELTGDLGTAADPDDALPQYYFQSQYDGYSIFIDLVHSVGTVVGDVYSIWNGSSYVDQEQLLFDKDYNSWEDSLSIWQEFLEEVFSDPSVTKIKIRFEIDGDFYEIIVHGD